MLIIIENLLDQDSLQGFQRDWQQQHWQAGHLTAGSVAAKVKQNLQLDDQCSLAISMRQQILQALSAQALFISAALPHSIYPPKFNCYKDSGHYGTHVDSAILYHPDNGTPLRSDLSATVFLSDADSYEGGELCIETDFGVQEVKLNAGDMVLYPANSLHQVLPVTRGQRLAAFFWVQSLVADGQQRSLLFDLDQSIQALRTDSVRNDAEIQRLTGVYHNLLRLWSQP